MDAGESIRGATVLVVEPASVIAPPLHRELMGYGVRVLSTECIRDALGGARGATFGLVVFDMGTTPDACLDCIEAMREQLAATPFVVLQAPDRDSRRGERCVRAFELGAEDFILKRVTMREMGLRVRNILRRRAAGRAHPVVDETETERDRSAPVFIDDGAFNAYACGRRLRLTLSEFKILATLVRSPGRVYARSQLLYELWGMRSVACSRRVDTHVRRIRMKLGSCAGTLQTVHGVGYVYNPTMERCAQ